MTTKHLSESTLNIRKVVCKEDVANRSLTNSIIEAIQCLINADSGNTEHVLLNIVISVTGVETGGEEIEKVTKKKLKKRAIVECEESVSKKPKLAENISKPEIVNKKIANRTKKLLKKRLPIQTIESVNKCTPSEKPKNTSSWDVSPANGKPSDPSKSGKDKSRTSKKGCKRTNSESDQKLTKKSKLSEKSKKITKKNIPTENISTKTEQKEVSVRKFNSSEESGKTTAKNTPVEHICTSTEQEQESVNKSTSSVKSEKIIAKNVPVVGIKSSSINHKKINFEQDKMDKKCFKAVRELEDALKQLIKKRSESEANIIEKLECIIIKKKNKLKNKSK